MKIRIAFLAACTGLFAFVTANAALAETKNGGHHGAGGAGAASLNTNNAGTLTLTGATKTGAGSRRSKFMTENPGVSLPAPVIAVGNKKSPKEKNPSR